MKGIEYWQNSVETLQRGIEFAEWRVQQATLKALGQLAIPIEAAMADEEIEWED